MKLFYYLVTLFLGCALIPSCSDEADFYVTPILDVSVASLEFTKASDNKTVEVTINENDEFYYTVSALGGTDWVEVTNLSNATLEVKVQNNPTFTTRTATVKLFLLKGDLTKSITVTQSAEDTPVIELSEGDMHLNSDLHLSIVYITRNTDTPWSAETLEDWITVSPFVDKDMFTIDVSENTEIESRVGVVTVTCGDLVREIKVDQDGIIYFILPYLDFGYNFKGPVYGYKAINNLIPAIEYEESRGSVFLQSLYDVLHQYTTKSPVMPIMAFSAAQGTQTYQAVAQMDIPSTVFLEGKYYEFLESNGFKREVFDLTKRVVIFWNKDLFLAAEMVLPYGTGKGQVQFLHMGASPDHPGGQTKQYPTFDQFPFPYMNWGATAEEIAKWEADKGGVLVETTETTVGYQPDQSKEPECAERAYIFDVTSTPAKYKEYVVLYNSIDLGFYPTSKNSYLMTSEFKDLIANAGFVFDRTTGSGTNKFNIYYNSELKVALLPNIRGYSSEDSMPRFCITMFPQETATTKKSDSPVVSFTMIEEAGSPGEYSSKY